MKAVIYPSLTLRNKISPKKPKTINIELAEKKRLPDAITGFVFDAKGSHGEVFDLIRIKGGGTGLCVKKYHPHKLREKKLTQSLQALHELVMFRKLRRMGFPVPPKIKLVRIEGELFVAITDLTIFGSEIGEIHQRLHQMAEKYNVPEQAKQISAEIERFEEEAKKIRINLVDSWEFIWDPKKRKIHYFVLDLSQN
ncbi:MAG TPA: hypothetical protein VJG83_00110 [archaeon]|nr:hypothetical protein [archaeon]